jgi:uncharacterized membrane protein YhdT
MRYERRQKPAFIRAQAGLVMIGTVFSGFLVAMAAGMTVLPTWLSMLLAIIPTLGMFLICWGLEEV